MNDLPKLYFTLETYLFPMQEEELGELTAKMREFLRIVEVVRPSRFMTSALRWCGLGRPMKDREKMLRAFFLKAVYDLPTTKVLIENLKTNPSLRRLCGWEYRGAVPSEATFSRAFKMFAAERVTDAIHSMIVKENYTDKLVGHASIDSTAIIGREKACRKNTPKIKLKKKRGRKSKAEKAALAEQELSETKTRRLELQPIRTLAENISDLTQGCDWGGKREDLPKFVPGKDLILMHNELKEVVIRNCHFGALRGNGVLLQTSNALIEDNLFENSAAGIRVYTCLETWFEGGPASNVVIRNNEFRNCMRRTINRTAVIEVKVSLREPFIEGAEGQVSLKGPQRNIKIIGNKILRSNNGGMAISSVDDCEIRKNLIKDVSLAPSISWGSNVNWSKNPVTIVGARNVVFEDNKYEGSTGKPGNIVIGEACENIQIDHNEGFKVLHENVLPQKGK